MNICPALRSHEKTQSFFTQKTTRHKAQDALGCLWEELTQCTVVKPWLAKELNMHKPMFRSKALKEYCRWFIGGLLPQKALEMIASLYAIREQ